MRRIAALALALGAASAGCSGYRSIEAQALAPADDAFHYRRFRAATTAEQRLASAWTYLRTFPRGEHAAEVRAWFDRAERHYRQYARNRVDLLQRYLTAVPEGPGATLARDRIQELRAAQRYAERRETAFAERAEALQEELAQAERARREFVGSFGEWVARLARLGPWGATLGDLHPEFLAAFQARPEPVCDATACTKKLTFPYAVPGPGKLAARRAVFSITLELRDGRVKAARLSGPALFDRLAEAQKRILVLPDDGLGRAEAIGTAVQLISAMVEPALPARSCHEEAVSPTVLARECGARRIRAIAADTPTADDRVEFLPLIP